jgi:2-polyprenyl-6-methoxyphenol hydroxylase-like FAD-dependent oxidoreductase
MIVLINRGDYWQCGFVIPKGTFAEIQRRGLSAFRDTLRQNVPFEPQRADEVESWDQVKLLTVGVDRLRRWYAPGVLCIGDAAHTMSPIGGVGINLAIQDAVAAANILAGPLQHGKLSEEHLRQVQQRREPPTRKTQALQVFIQNRVIRRVLDPGRQVSPPLLVRALNWFPLLQRLTARVIGIGFLPEHVQTPPSR